MSRQEKESNSGDPKPLNFDQDQQKGPIPSKTPEEERGDDQNTQYYEEEEALSPEEAKLRKKEGTL